MTGKRVVFTGGTGKAGRHVLPHLISKGYELLNVDLKPFDHPGIHTLIADLTDSGQAFNALTTHFGFDRFKSGKPPLPPDAVVHFAAESHVDRSIYEPAPVIQTNVTGTFIMLQVSRTLGIERFVHISTDEVYGDMAPGQFADSPAPSRKRNVAKL